MRVYVCMQGKWYGDKWGRGAFINNFPLRSVWLWQNIRWKKKKTTNCHGVRYDTFFSTVSFCRVKHAEHAVWFVSEICLSIIIYVEIYKEIRLRASNKYLPKEQITRTVNNVKKSGLMRWQQNDTINIIIHNTCCTGWF